MAKVEEIRKAQRAEGPTMVLAMGTSTPPNCVNQSTYLDYYFRITKSEHKIELKEKFKGISLAPLFELVSADHTSEGAIAGHLRQVGLTFHLHKKVSALISENIEKSLVEAFQPLGITDWNSLFWIAHPGGPAILDQIEATLALTPEKLRATRHVLSEYVNMSSANVFFILDEMRKKSKEHGVQTTYEGLEPRVGCFVWIRTKAHN